MAHESLELQKALRAMRVFHDLSQGELAKKLKISKSYLSEIEAGKKQPSLVLLQRYSAVFDVSLSSILFLSENMESKTPLDFTVSQKVVTMLRCVSFATTVKQA